MTKITRSMTQLLSLVLLSVLATACYTPPKQVSDLASLKNDDIVMVGRIEIIPVRKREEITLGPDPFHVYDDIHRRFLMITSDRYYDFKGVAGGKDYETNYHIFSEEDYYIPAKQGVPFMIMGGNFHKKLIAGREANIIQYKIGDGIKVDYPKGSKAIYIGTIRITRDKDFNIENIELDRSDFKNVQQRFQKKFHTNMKLVKASLSSAKPE